MDQTKLGLNDPALLTLLSKYLNSTNGVYDKDIFALCGKNDTVCIASANYVASQLNTFILTNGNTIIMTDSTSRLILTDQWNVFIKDSTYFLTVLL